MWKSQLCWGPVFLLTNSYLHLWTVIKGKLLNSLRLMYPSCDFSHIYNRHYNFKSYCWEQGFYFMCMGVCLHISVCTALEARRGIGSTGTELAVISRCELEMELGSCRRAASAVNPWVISPALAGLFLIFNVCHISMLKTLFPQEKIFFVWLL